jgi:hypothetical protein
MHNLALKLKCRPWGRETKQALSPRPTGEPFCGCGEGKPSRRSLPDNPERNLAVLGKGNQADALSQTTWRATWRLWEREAKQTLFPRPPGEPFGGCGRGKPSRRSLPDHLESDLVVVGEGNKADVLSQTAWRAIWRLRGRERKQTFSPRPPGEPFGGCGRGKPSRRSLPEHLESNLAAVRKGSQADVLSPTTWRAIWLSWEMEDKQTPTPKPPRKNLEVLQARDLQAAIVADLWVSALTL